MELKRLFLRGMAVALLAGGLVIGSPVNSVYADDDEGPAVVVKLTEKEAYAHYIQPIIDRAVVVAADLSGEEFDDVLNRLRDGSSLAEAVRMDENRLSNELLKPVLQQLDELKAAGRIDAGTAQTLNETALKNLLSKVSFSVTDSGKNSDPNALLEQELGKLITYTILLSDDDDGGIEITDVLFRGGSLAEASDLKGQELQAKLTQIIYAEIDSWQQAGNISTEQQVDLKQRAGTEIQKIISGQGIYFKEAALEKGQKLIDEKVRRLASDAVTVSDRDISDVLDHLYRGLSLTEATGLTASQLTTRLETQLFNELEALHRQGGLTGKHLTELKQKASAAISEALLISSND